MLLTLRTKANQPSYYWDTNLTPLDFLKEHGLTVLDGQHSLQSRLMDLTAHREATRDAIQCSTDCQAFQHDKGRKAPQLDLGDEVQIGRAHV